jgi:hypothetical protein
MNLESILENTFILQLIKVLLFIFMFMFSTSYLISKGVFFYTEWKETKERRKLSTSISFIAGGIFILLYFLAMFILESPRLAK